MGDRSNFSLKYVYGDPFFCSFEKFMTTGPEGVVAVWACSDGISPTNNNTEIRVRVMCFMVIKFGWAKLNKKVIEAIAISAFSCPSNASFPLKNVEIRDIVEMLQKNFLWAIFF